MQGRPADQTRMWPIALTEYVLIEAATFIMNAKDKNDLNYYTGSHRFDHASGGMLFPLSVRIIDALACFGLYMFALQIWTNRVLKISLYKGCTEVSWDGTATTDRFMQKQFKNE